MRRPMLDGPELTIPQYESWPVPMIPEGWDTLVTMMEALEAPCPTCQAEAGQPCTQPTNEGRRAVNWVHDARKDAAQGWT